MCIDHGRGGESSSLHSRPLLFLAALGLAVPRMQLGTAVIPLRFENPGRLTEDLATADLLLGGRLRPGLSSGCSAHDAVEVEAFGHVRGERGEHVDRVLSEVLPLLEGKIVSPADTRIVLEEPSVVAQALLADPVIQGADEIVLVLPHGADGQDQLRVLESFAQQGAPRLLTALV